MKAITLHQPWASLIADGAKPFETRSWAPPAGLVGRRIAIHAGLRIDVRAAEDFGYPYPAGSPSGLVKPIPTGVVLCTAVLRGASLSAGPMIGGKVWGVRVENGRAVRIGEGPPHTLIDPYGDYSDGRWIWWLTDISPLAPPFEARGRQGLWDFREGE